MSNEEPGAESPSPRDARWREEERNDSDWDIGITKDDLLNTLGLIVRRRFSRDVSRFEWPVSAPASQIAQRLREAAAFLEEQDE